MMNMETELRKDFRAKGWKRSDISIEYAKIRIKTENITKQQIMDILSEYVDYSDSVKCIKGIN
jgi:hypothetical protein